MVIDVLEFVLVAYLISVAFAALIMAICISHLWLHRHDPDYHTVLRMFIRMAPAHIFLWPHRWVYVPIAHCLSPH